MRLNINAFFKILTKQLAPHLNIYRLDSSLLPALETRPIHPSQRLTDQDGDRYEFSLRVIINPELVNELVRFGRELEVLAPESLKEMVAARLG